MKDEHKTYLIEYHYHNSNHLRCHGHGYISVWFDCTRIWCNRLEYSISAGYHSWNRSAIDKITPSLSREYSHELECLYRSIIFKATTQFERNNEKARAIIRGLTGEVLQRD